MFKKVASFEPLRSIYESLDPTAFTHIFFSQRYKVKHKQVELSENSEQKMQITFMAPEFAMHHNFSD